MASLRAPSDGRAAALHGRLALYLGYEVAAEIEPRLPCRRAATRWPRWRFARQRRGYATAPRCSRGWWPSRVMKRCSPTLRITSVKPPRIGRRSPIHPAARGWWSTRKTRICSSTPSLAALDYIAAGDVYQTNLSRQWQVSSEPPDRSGGCCTRDCAPPIQARSRAMLRFGALSRDQFLARAAVVDSRRHCLDAADRRHPPARYVTASATRHWSSPCSSNEKERAEHVMLIDLERNDLGRVCVGGTVRVDEFMASRPTHMCITSCRT